MAAQKSIQERGIAPMYPTLAAVAKERLAGGDVGFLLSLHMKCNVGA